MLCLATETNKLLIKISKILMINELIMFPLSTFSALQNISKKVKEISVYINKERFLLHQQHQATYRVPKLCNNNSYDWS